MEQKNEGGGAVKKQVYRRAMEIAADLMSRMDACVMPPERPCRIKSGEAPTPWDCGWCIEKYLVRKAKEELKREKEVRNVKTASFNSARNRF